MVELDAILQELPKLEAAQDFEGLRRVREQIVTDFPDAAAAGEALYKIGLDQLFRQRDLVAAMETFERAAKRKQRYWSDAARTSLGLCYHHQQRTQKALFELRKVAYQENPSAHSVTALAFMETIHHTENKGDEAAKVRKDRITQLEKLLATATGVTPSERGYYFYSLGLALLDNGETARAKEALQQAKAVGRQALGDELYRAVIGALG